MSANTAVPDFSCEQDMCLEEPQDFEDVQDCDISLDLLRMVKQEEKQIMPHEKEVIENIALEEGKEDIFPWSYQDMPGLSTDIVVHRLPIRQECKPVQQKLRRMRPDIVLKIKDEVKKQFDAGFLQEVKDLNKASPKDNFPLPHIDTLVDNNSGYSLFSFMDGFSGYNQIKMHPEDMDKTTFITLWGTFCYKVMSFGLKNAGATYQRAMLKLNPAKCTFGARSGKLLGFVVSEKELKLTQTRSEPYESCLCHKCDPIFRLLRKHNQGTWDEECQNAFEKVKQYLLNAPVLSPPSPDKPLILYLSVFSNSMGCVLGQHDESRKKEKAIYYLSKKFTDCEMRYSPIEKLCCTLIWTTRRLRQYMLYHTTWLISKLDPLKYMMESTALNGRMARWQILLSEFDIVYVSQKAIKGSAVVDFLASRALEDYEPLNFDFPNEELMCIATTEDSPWKLNFDGASNAVRNGIGAVLVSPNGDHYPFTCKLDFDCTNNMAEYEACIMGLQAAIERGIKTLEVYGDSALVIYQLRGEWETRDPKLINYRMVVLGLLREFDDITFNYLPRDENRWQML
ncbi:hypothetical protein CXB51_005149 [Gossypium anomalum]|uniref:RNase H type-1 domain-containing protein n=1 Tax=Gossypium anomalum TaxID=47600 RepID=A0A8J5ZBQ5_9ROSI|nr:hypothetical protein CXB51_005149 [Gossypium anomalum]